MTCILLAWGALCIAFIFGFFVAAALSAAASGGRDD